MNEFAHLHLHTEFSLLDGMGRIDEYVSRAQELGIQHMAVTDHGVMYAAMDWYQAGVAAGLHPIIGMEAYLAEGPISKRERKSYHLLLLAENDKGYRNLLKLASTASLEGFYYRPRVDLELLQQYGEGIIATSACLGGPVANNFLHDNPEAARRYAGELSEIFGKDRFYIELQDHGLKEQLQTNGEMIDLARELNLPLVATNDVHYCSEHDASAQDVLVCVQTNTTIHDPKRMKTDSNQFFLKGPDEMARLFADTPEAISNTIRIAEMCHVDLGFKGYQLPHFDVPGGFTPDTYLRHLCERGAMERYGTVEGAVGERLDYELGIIESMGFTSYFLVTWDFVHFAKTNDILVGPGRGSSAGSIVTYCLNITGLDPLKYDLIFERFLNPARISMPDIDIDFADDRRSEVIDYVVRKYGDDRVAQIVTFGTLKAKAAVRDVGRALGMSFADTDRVARLIPVDPKMTIAKALESVPELTKLLAQEQHLRELVDTARKVEGLARHSSTHAAGVVISRDPLVQHVPLQRAGGKSEGEVTTQFPMAQLEGIGLLKMDFLGLKTLTVIRKAIDQVRKAGHDISLESIPLDDPVAMQGLCRGETAGVFQLEGGMTTRMTTDVAPTAFEDIVALSALIRPGPMQMAPEYIARRHGRASTEYMHPLMEPILKETHGVPLYQEQVMQIANVVAGFSMAESDGLRKAMGKKLPAEMAKYRDRFIDGCRTNDIAAKLAGDIFDMIERFAGYGFPKAHSAAYGVITAQTAYLKANYPVEFMAALMSTEMGATDKTVFNVVECRRAGIPLLPPDVNRSQLDYSVEEFEGKQSIRFGLGAVKNVGLGAVESILASRTETIGQQFASLEAFCNAIDWSAVNKRVAECLAKTGALDCFGERAAILASLEPLIGAAQHRQKAAARGQMDLFGGAPEIAPVGTAMRLAEVPPADRKQLLAWEKELLGLYLSSHPLMDWTGNGAPDGRALLAEIGERSPGSRAQFIGMVTTIRRITTRNNRTMAVMEVEDLTGSIEVVAFPDTYEQYAEVICEDAILDFQAKVDERGEKKQLILEQATADLPVPKMLEQQSPLVIIVLPSSAELWQDIDAMQTVDDLLRRHEGPNPVEFHISTGTDVLRLRSRTRRVEWSTELEHELGDVLGASGVFLREPAPLVVTTHEELDQGRQLGDDNELREVA
ncbi:MAG: DNA polymerase III subunit alpha [Chloroflexota bacterium]|nr:DNA polymerase III subunit alpha [Chloroflexota bacterium]